MLNLDGFCDADFEFQIIETPSLSKDLIVATTKPSASRYILRRAKQRRRSSSHSFIDRICSTRSYSIMSDDNKKKEEETTAAEPEAVPEVAVPDEAAAAAEGDDAPAKDEESTAHFEPVVRYVLCVSLL
jgi:hypothetical protein